MIIRLGYVAIAEPLEVTSSHTVTYSIISKKENKLEIINNIIKTNLDALDKIIEYNIKNDIHFYRLTSKLIPFATHPEFKVNYLYNYLSEYKSIADKIELNKMRVDLHPDQFAVLNSTNKEVVNNTINILKYSYNILKSLKIKDKTIVLHIGSNVFGKEKSIKRFINNFKSLPIYLKQSIAIENDDKIYNIKDIVEISKILNIPIVLDYHHHICNGNNLDIDDYLEYIINSWPNQNCKMHFSSSKSHLKKEYRAHNDYINSDDFINFIEHLKPYNKDIDIMIEAKRKDDALFRLVREIKYKTDYKFIDSTSFIV